MAQSVKLGNTEYRAIKAYAKKTGKFIEYLLNEAVRKYLAEVAVAEKEHANR